MVKKILGFFSREVSHINQAALLLGIFAGLSQILAFLRDRMLAHIFGASRELDIYYAAFRIPDFIFITIASVVSISVLVPFILEKEAESKEALKDFLNNVFFFFWILVVLVSVVAYLLIPSVSTLLFKGFDPGDLAQTIYLSRLLLLSPIILGLSNLLGSITQAYNRFTIYATAPLLYNAGIILGIVFLAERLGVLGVAIGVVVGASLHALVQVPFVWKEGLLPRLRLNLNVSQIMNVATISIPRTLTLSMSSIAILFLVSLGSLMTEGSVSIFSFSFNLASVPLSLIGVSYSLAAFPTLTRRFQENNISAFIDQMSTTARFIIFWSLPLSALLLVLRAQVVRVILGTGLFDWNATRLTAAAFAIFVLSSVFQSLLLLFMRGFYSAGNTLKPLLINVLSTVSIMSIAYGMYKWFLASESLRYSISSLMRVEDLPGTAVLVLPLAFSLGMAINALILWAAFEYEFRGFSRVVARTVLEGLCGAIVMGVVAYFGLSFFVEVLDTTTLVGIFLQGFLALIVGIFAGVVTLVLMKSRELKEVWEALHKRFWKTEVIATDPEIV